MDDAVYLIAFYGGPADGFLGQFTGLDSLGLPNSRTMLDWPTDQWVHRYLVQWEEPYWGQTLRAERVMVSPLPASDLTGCPGMEG